MNPFARFACTLAFAVAAILGLGAASTALAQDTPAPAPAAAPAAPAVPAPEAGDALLEAHGDTHAPDAVAHADAGSHDAHAKGGHGPKVTPHPIWLLPFVVVLLSIALFPLFAPHFWEHYYPYVAGALFLVGFLYYAVVRSDLHPWLHEMQEYVSFISLLFALFVISGGIGIHVSRTATPAANVLLLLIGAVIANLFGTTGASMLLIRPYIRMNKGHIKPYHIVFFIFIVGNVGGCLTPIGDPPLFLGYLKGVPFWWVFEHCWQPWFFINASLLGIFFVIDKMDHVKAARTEDPTRDTGPAVRITGMLNFVLIFGVVGSVFLDSVFVNWAAIQEHGVTAGNLFKLACSREISMVSLALASRQSTHAGIYQRNGFTFGPIREVAIIFLAIFSTMKPALEYLDGNAKQLPIQTPGHFYFAAGSLSAVLDNAPTYLTFLQMKLGTIPEPQIDEIQRITDELYVAYQAAGDRRGPDDVTTLLKLLPVIPDADFRLATIATIQAHADHIIEHKGHVPVDELKLMFLTGVPRYNAFLVAISLGAVFFGAMTYIGNAPNFMIKSIAESSGIKMPSFLGFVFRYSLPILLPVLIGVWAIFFWNAPAP